MSAHFGHEPVRRRTPEAAPRLARVEAVHGGARVPGLDGFLAEVQQRAYRFAFYELWDREAALDAVQDSMLRLTERYADRPASEWPAIFFTILRNRTTDVKRWRLLERVRGLVRGERRDDGAPELWDGVAGPAHELPEAQVAAREQRAAIDTALRALPERQRQVFLLREWQGLSTLETAATLGCSAGAVKQHHFRALKALRARLSEVWDDDTQ